MHLGPCWGCRFLEYPGMIFRRLASKDMENLEGLVRLRLMAAEVAVSRWHVHVILRMLFQLEAYPDEHSIVSRLA